MRLPRRVPWSSLAELDQVCSWIFTDENDLDTKVLAVNRLSAWRVITPLPHALDATLSLLSSILLDRPPVQQTALVSSTSVTGGGFFLNVRQSYATAIVRFVNGLVDPLQLGTYARSIASIAAQIGLPHWLVELRHAITHEELPSLELLRSGTNEALNWLLHNYFLPTLSSPNFESQNQPAIDLSPLSALLKQYKTLLKITTRDASLKTQYKAGITKTLRDIERWIGEAKVAASSILYNGFGAGAGEMEELDDDRERWALERLAESLLERDGLVPVSSKKRLASKQNASPVLPPALVAIWSSLLRALQARHPSFASTLVTTIVSQLLAEKDESQTRDLSYDLCLAGWAHWCIDTLGVSDVNADASVIREEAVGNLIIAFGPDAKGDKSQEKRGATALLDLLLQEDERLKQIAASLRSIASSAQTADGAWQDKDAQLMEERLNSLLASAQSSLSSPRNADAIMEESISGHEERDRLPEGWSLVSNSSWHTCPIGIYVK